MKRLLAAIAVVAACSCAGVDARVDQLLKDAQVELRAGQIDGAQSLVDRGFALTQSAPDSLPAWRLRLLNAELQIARLNLGDASVDLEKPIPEGPEFAALRARQQFLVAQVQLARGQLQQALATLDAATAQAKDPELLADIEILGSQARLRLGQWDDAEQRLNAVAKAAASRSDRYREALAINNLGMSRLIRSRFDEALQRFETVLAQEDLEPTRAYALALNNAGICLARLGEYDRALAAQRRAVEIQEQRGSKADLMRALGELGTTHYLRDEIPQAMPYLQRALSIATGAGLNADGWVWAYNLALGHLQLGQFDEAAKYNAEARRLNPPDRAARLVQNTATDAEIAAGRGDRAGAARLFNEVLATSVNQPSVNWLAQMGLARIAAQESHTSVAATHFQAALTTIEKTRSALLKADYRLSFLTRVIGFYRDYVNFLMATGQSDRALEIADSSRGRVLAERLGVAAPSRGAATTFRARARETDQTFVFYWLAPRQSWAWVISAQGIRTVPLAPKDEIDALVAQYHAQIQNTSVDPLTAVDGPGERLYARIIAPLAGKLPRNGGIVIVPDGALHRLNFETLPVRDAAKAHYLIEDATIQIAPSLATMTAAKTARAERPLLLVGNPTPREPDFPALTYAAAEMEGVSKPFGDNVTMLQSDRASPAAFRAAKPEQFSRIHFTSHALANTESPMDSAVILSGPDSAYKLYARDVAEMPLAADLVTVSACRSAGDRAYSGEGLVGFAWAFLRAGSRRVVAGLWDVDDRSTAALMSDFYTRLAAGEPAPSALRNAKLALVRERKMKPYYWAPLQMFTAAP